MLRGPREEPAFEVLDEVLLALGGLGLGEALVVRVRGQFSGRRAAGLEEQEGKQFQAGLAVRREHLRPPISVGEIAPGQREPLEVIFQQEPAALGVGADGELLQDLVALAKAKPGQLNYGSTGNGGTSNLMGEMLKTMAKIDMVHIPYKGLAPALTDMMGGQINVAFGGYSTVGELWKSGRVRAIAVTSAKRSPYTPDLPTIAEYGFMLRDFSERFDKHELHCE